MKEGMKLKVMLVNPPVLAVLEPWFDTPKFVRTGLAVLAAYCRQSNEFDIKCLDAKFEKLNFDETVERVGNWQPDVVAIGAFTNEVKPAAYLAGRIKKVLPHVVTILGGAHLTAIPEQTMYEFPTIDIGVMGEGEETLLELLRALRDKKTLLGIDGVVFRLSGNIVKNKERPRILDQDSLPMPAWDLFPPAEEYYIQTIRGCPFACVFCLNHNGKVARKRSVEKVIEEMQWLVNYGAKRISFGDELFSVDMLRTAELMDAMIACGIGEKVSWDIQTHVAYVNDQLFEKMKRANIEKCEMGVESGDETALKRMGKSIDKEMILNAFRSAQKHKIKTGSFFILGQPNETRKTILSSIRLAIKINPTEPIFGSMVPYPGTQVAYMAAKGEAGYRLVTTDWDEYRKQLNGSLELTNISRNTIEWFQILGYISVFIFNLRIFDFFNFFWSYRMGALNLFQKALFNSKSTAVLVHKPEDYDKTINSPGKISMDEILISREYWKKIQSGEVQRTKNIMPHLLKEQMPVQALPVIQK